MGPWLVALVGALIVAAGLGVVVRTKWASNVPNDDKAERYRLSWPVVAVGLVVLAAGVVMAMAHDHSGGSTNDNTANVNGGIANGATSAGSADGSRPAQESASSSSSVPKPDVVRWSGPLTLRYGGGASLDSIPPKYDYWAGVYDIGSAGTSLLGSLAKWTNPGIPNRKQCSDWVDTMNGGDNSISVGTIVCVKTSHGRTARVKVTSASDDGPTVLDVTVWENP